MIRQASAVALLAGLLHGCTGGMMFIGPDGATHQGTFDAVAKTMTVSIRGIEYSGSYVLGGSPGRTATTTSTTVSSTGRVGVSSGQTYIPGSGGGNGRALLASPAGALSCEFTYQGMTAIGACQDQAGQQYQFQTR